MPKAQYHTLSKGESLQAVARRFNTSEHSLLLLNGLLDSEQIAAGDVLFVGYRGSSRSPSTLAPKQALSRSKLAWPVKAQRISSVFGPRWNSFHDGLDFAAKTGTPVYAAHDGEVRYAGSKLGGYGKLVIIEGYDGLTTVYAHNSKLLVSKGDRLLKGQKIALVGSTGKSTGPHLHFEVRTKDSKGRFVAVDPLPVLRGNSKKPRFRVNESLSPLLAKRSKSS